MMADILTSAAEQGYAPEMVVCAGETPSGRPAPLMTWKALIALDAWPARACIKVDDAPVGIEEGRLAGCWTIGLSASGNGVGLDLEAFSELPAEQRREPRRRFGTHIERGRRRLRCGRHFAAIARGARNRRPDCEIVSAIPQLRRSRGRSSKCRASGCPARRLRSSRSMAG